MSVQILKYFSVLLYSFFMLSCQNGTNQHRNSSLETKKAEQNTVLNEKLSVITDSAIHEGIHIHIYQKDTLAFIKIQSQDTVIQQNLLLKAPVYIIRKDKSEDVLVYSYPKFHIDQLLLLAGGDQLDSSEKSVRGIADTINCSTHIQGLIFNKDGIFIGKDKLENMSCKGFSADEKDFYALAELYEKK